MLEYQLVMALEYLLEHSGCEDVLFSVSGIREGYLYSTLDDVTRQQDALIASALELASFSGRGDHYAREVFEWLNPIFVHDDNQRNRLRRTACLLGEVAWPIDPNFRGEWAFNRVLQSSLKGANHKERIMLALALYHRYHSKWKHESGVLSLLDEHERLWAKAVGTALNLAFQLSGGLAGNLNHASLRLQDDQVELLLEPVAQPLRNETVEKRLEGLGSTFKALSNFFI